MVQKDRLGNVHITFPGLDIWVDEFLIMPWGIKFLQDREPEEEDKTPIVCSLTYGGVLIEEYDLDIEVADFRAEIAQQIEHVGMIKKVAMAADENLKDMASKIQSDDKKGYG
jgi:hypothetical protein